MKITIIAVGSLSQEYQVLYNEYTKRISRFAKVELIEIKEQKIENIELKIQKETQLIIEKIPKNSNVIYLSLRGKQVSSEQFGNYFLDLDNTTFIIGGSNGVDESKFNKQINFSKMTFPHQLFRVMLVEQIYRAFTIKHNIKYHK
ncbi:23S rRNA (pseudouridine(1915)-N(3))-methyltransferase RlmH [Mycoplasmopsis sturni]|uniref:23S rRNA (pseudouridine(1915)-N(3))-methyltransferase RlmH n=1 Tax=Mycoplasmopsis sturni TaxID=39047 RepID=UPI00056468E6|nr:23S rRNA (pseudouridine(1915)-N(3))-methyltransferase RlmH [Mycoplasmopsis sturni]